MDFQITLHPATVHFPIALLTLASICGLLYIYWRQREELLILTWWPMAIGWISGAIGIGTGLWAQSGLPPQSLYTQLLNWHIGTAIATLLFYGAVLYWRWLRRDGRGKVLGQNDDLAQRGDPLLGDQSVRVWVSLLLLAGLIILLSSGWTGGQLVYTWGVNTP